MYTGVPVRLDSRREPGGATAGAAGVPSAAAPTGARLGHLNPSTPTPGDGLPAGVLHGAVCCPAGRRVRRERERVFSSSSPSSFSFLFRSFRVFLFHAASFFSPGFVSLSRPLSIKFALIFLL